MEVNHRPPHSPLGPEVREGERSPNHPPCRPHVHPLPPCRVLPPGVIFCKVKTGSFWPNLLVTGCRRLWRWVQPGVGLRDMGVGEVQRVEEANCLSCFNGYMVGIPSLLTKSHTSPGCCPESHCPVGTQVSWSLDLPVIPAVMGDAQVGWDVTLSLMEVGSQGTGQRGHPGSGREDSVC